jgi:hypothetical protein
MAIVRGLITEIDAALERGDEDGRLGAVMALDAFLSVVRPPPEERDDGRGALSGHDTE